MIDTIDMLMNLSPDHLDHKRNGRNEIRAYDHNSI